MTKKTAVFGLYATPDIAENAVDHLLAIGFNNSDISVLLPDDENTRAFAHEKHTKAPEGTATGAATGGVIGGAIGLLAGIGALAIPGVGPLIAAGPILGALAGMGAGGAVGGFVGAFVGLGIPEYEAKRFEGAVKGGGTLLSVHCETWDEVNFAKKALKETGAHDIASSAEQGSGKEDEVTDELRNAYTERLDAQFRNHGADYELNRAYLRDEVPRNADHDQARADWSEVDPYDAGLAVGPTDGHLAASSNSSVAESEFRR